MSEDDTNERRITGHPLRSKVRPAIPANEPPWVLVLNRRAGYITIPIQDRPAQRTAIEREGGVWDGEVWRFSNAKQRDALQRELDDAATKASDSVRGMAVKLAPGLNLVGQALLDALDHLQAFKRVSHHLEAIDVKTVKTAALLDHVKNTGVPAVLRYLLEVDGLDARVVKAATAQLEDLVRGRKTSKVSRVR